LELSRSSPVLISCTASSLLAEAVGGELSFFASFAGSADCSVGISKLSRSSPGSAKTAILEPTFTPFEPSGCY
jgi:hypothetical protein